MGNRSIFPCHFRCRLRLRCPHRCHDCHPSCRRLRASTSFLPGYSCTTTSCRCCRRICPVNRCQSIVRRAARIPEQLKYSTRGICRHHRFISRPCPQPAGRNLCTASVRKRIFFRTVTDCDYHRRCDRSLYRDCLRNHDAILASVLISSRRKIDRQSPVCKCHSLRDNQILA